MLIGDAPFSGVSRDLLGQAEKYSGQWWLTYLFCMLYMFIAYIVIANFFTGLVVDSVVKQIAAGRKWVNQQPVSTHSTQTAGTWLHTARVAISIAICTSHLVTCVLFGQWNQNASIYHYDIAKTYSTASAIDGGVSISAYHRDSFEWTRSSDEFRALQGLNAFLLFLYVVELCFIGGVLRSRFFVIDSVETWKPPWRGEWKAGIQWTQIWKISYLAVALTACTTYKDSGIVLFSVFAAPRIFDITVAIPVIDEFFRSLGASATAILRLLFPFLMFLITSSCVGLLMFGYDISKYPFDGAMVSARIPCLLKMMLEPTYGKPRSGPCKNAASVVDQSKFFMRNLTVTGVAATSDDMARAYRNTYLAYTQTARSSDPCWTQPPWIYGIDRSTLPIDIRSKPCTGYFGMEAYDQNTTRIHYGGSYYDDVTLDEVLLKPEMRFCDPCKDAAWSLDHISAVRLGSATGSVTTQNLEEDCYTTTAQRVCGANMDSYITVTVPLHTRTGSVFKIFLGIPDDRTVIFQDYFSSIFMGVMTLFQMFTGDSWSSGVTRNLLSQTAKKFDGDWWMIWVFTIFYMFVAALVIGNFFTGMIVDIVNKQLQVVQAEHEEGTAIEPERSADEIQSEIHRLQAQLLAIRGSPKVDDGEEMKANGVEIGKSGEMSIII